jgi:hypothetical protein
MRSRSSAWRNRLALAASLMLIGLIVAGYVGNAPRRVISDAPVSSWRGIA